MKIPNFLIKASNENYNYYMGFKTVEFWVPRLVFYPIAIAIAITEKNLAVAFLIPYAESSFYLYYTVLEMKFRSNNKDE